MKTLPCNKLKGERYGPSTSRVLLVKLGINLETTPSGHAEYVIKRCNLFQSDITLIYC